MDPQIHQQLGRMESMLETIAVKTDKLTEAFYGNGKPGILTRVDRLEQSDKRHRWAARTLIAGAVAFVCDVIFRFIYH